MTTLTISITAEKTTLEQLQEFADKLRNDKGYNWLADVFKELQLGK